MNLEMLKNMIINNLKKDCTRKIKEIDDELTLNGYVPKTYITEENQVLLIEKAKIQGWLLGKIYAITNEIDKAKIVNINIRYPYNYTWDSHRNTKYFIIPTAEITDDMITESVFDSIDKFQTSVDDSQKVVPVENPSSIFNSYTGYTWDVIDNVILSTNWYSQEEHDAKLLSLKKGKIGLVKMKTGNLIFSGMPYTVTINGVSKDVKFDMTEIDQLNYTGLDNKKDTKVVYGEGTGQVVACKDAITGEKLYWYPADEPALKAFTDAIFDFAKNYINSGHDLEKEIMATTTLAELGAIVDNRT